MIGELDLANGRVSHIGLARRLSFKSLLAELQLKNKSYGEGPITCMHVFHSHITCMHVFGSHAWGIKKLREALYIIVYNYTELYIIIYSCI